MQLQFVNNKDIIRAEESVLVKHKRNIQSVSRNLENFVEQLKQKYNAILFRMLYHNILAVLGRSILKQLKYKKEKKNWKYYSLKC